MQIGGFISIFILLVLWGAQFKLRSLLRKKIKLISAVAILLPTIPLLIYSYTLYHIWLNSPAPIRYFLPPYTEINYYLFTIGRRFWLVYFIATTIALIFLLLIHLIKKEKRDLIFEKDEPYLIAIAIALVGHPNWIIYILTTLLTYLFLSLINKGKRVSMYYLWLPIGILLIAASPLLLNIEMLNLLRLNLYLT